MSVRYALLGLLAQRPRHGYELHAAFEALVGGTSNWEIKLAQVYSTLTRLEKAGWIELDTDADGDDPDKRVFCLTPRGHEALLDWFSSEIAPEHTRDEFYVKLMLVLASGEVDPHQVIQVQRAQFYQNLHAATTHRDRLDARSELAQILLLDKAIMHLEADLRWLDIVEMRLDEVMKQPLPEPELRPRGRPAKNDSVPELAPAHTPESG